ncbi:MAG TPA: glycosyl hydrolase family 28-related protein, partial [Armatimonadota bacterium]|nr:glycosyl hydrolase family 28-related protein [Armatimonadota bacterium]
LIVLPVLAILMGTASAQPGAVPAEHPFSLSARDFGAVGDGKTDDTAAIQGALDKAAEDGGGIVQLPRGDYRIATHLTVPYNVTLEGVFSVPTAYSQGRGTTLLAEEGRGSEEGPPFIALGRNSAIKGLTIYYPNQDVLNEIVPYPWCIATMGWGQGRGNSENTSIVDVLMVNPYMGVNFADGGGVRHYIRNLYGEPLRIGIKVDNCVDVGRIENVHFWPFSSSNGGSAARRFRATQGEAFVFGRTDWQYVLNTFCIGYKIGYHFIRTEHGACSGNFVGIGADSSNVAVQVDVVDPYSSGILITNGEFVSNSGDDSTHVRVAATNPGPVRFSNCAFWGTGDRVALLEGSGNTTFSGCLFRAWDRNSVGRAAIDLLNGALIVSGCQFAGAGTGVHLGPDAQAASVFGNHFAGTEAVADDSDGAVAIGLNITGR